MSISFIHYLSIDMRKPGFKLYTKMTTKTMFPTCRDYTGKIAINVISVAKRKTVWVFL